MRAIKILFVEDLATDVELAQRELKREKIEFTARVVDTEKGMRKELAEFQPDLIISDYSMPRFDGMSALKIARFEPNNIPFIMLTGSMNEETAVACMKAGADDYVLKEKIRRLPFTVREVMDKRAAQEEKERLLRQIHASEKRFRTIMSSMQDIVFTLDREQRHTGVYGPWVEQQGMTPEDFLGKTAREILGAANATVHEEANTKALEGEFVVYEWSAETKQGTCYYQTSLSPIVDDNGEVSGLVGIGRDITQIKQAEQALRESERQNAFLAQTGFELVRLTSIQEIYAYTGRKLYELINGSGIVTVVEYNEAANRWRMKHIEGVNAKLHSLLTNLFGFDVSQIEGEINTKHINKVKSGKLVELEFDLPTLFNNKVSEKIGKAVKKLLPVEKIHCLSFQQAEQIFGNVTFILNKKSKPLNAGLIEAFIFYVANFIKKQQSEQALRISEEKMRSIYNVAPIGIGVVVDRIIKDVNPRICEMTGYSRAELINKDVRLLYPTQADYNYVGNEKYRQIREKGTGIVETRWRRNDGVIIDIYLTSTPIEPGDLRRGITFTALDVTERKQAEKERLKSTELQRAIVESSPLPIFSLDLEGNVLSWNRAAEKTFGWTAEEVIGKPLPIVPEEDRQDVERLINRIREEGDFTGVELECRKKSSETIIISVSAAVLYDENGNMTGSLATVEDITERKRILAEKETLEAQLHQSQKLESVGTLASGVAHDFNNLLTVIMGHAQMGLMNTDEEDPLNRSLNQILTASTSASNLTRQLLLFSRKEVMEFKSVNINQTIQNLLKMLGRLIGENIEIETILEPDVWMIEADEGNLEQVLTNLAVNARDAMPDGGKLTIQTENVQITEADKKHILNAEVGNYVRIGISDNGKGIPEDIRDKIFDPFFTTKASGRGTGLGLSVVYGIVKKHDGWINVSSKVGKGARFTIYFPATGKMAQSDDKEAIPDFESLQGNGERVLLIEDEESVLEFTLDALRQYKYKVFPVSTGKEARTVFERESGKFDLIFSDVILPDTNGYELVKNLTGGKTDIPIILSSGYTDERVREQIGQDASINFIQKPYSILKMLEMVKIALQKSQIN
ncbi:MAG TPA: PAS domain S-box protein [Candidatus Marinimicrobia bacterium]|nr:PAS domain S-box protein [Candidatus Neomarinimicrobiota bacterium]